jgi:hypothetical protein
MMPAMMMTNLRVPGRASRDHKSTMTVFEVETQWQAMGLNTSPISAQNSGGSERTLGYKVAT